MDTWVTAVGVWEEAVLFPSEPETGSVATKFAATTTSPKMYAVFVVALAVTMLRSWPILGTQLRGWTRPRLRIWGEAPWVEPPALDLLVAAAVSVRGVATVSNLVDLLAPMPFLLVWAQAQHPTQPGSTQTSALLLGCTLLARLTVVRRLLSSPHRMDLRQPVPPTASMALENATHSLSSQVASTT